MWNKLKENGNPIVLYGTGNAADKIIDECIKREIQIDGIFASDGFVRSRQFRGYPVLSYSEAKEKFGNMRVLLCFGSHLPNVMDNFMKISREQDLYAPDIPVIGEGIFDEDYYECHKDKFEQIRTILADEKSREVFDGVIEYKLSGKINYLLSCQTEDADNWNLLNLNSHEQYLDLGAYNGDTVRMFLTKVKEYERIVAVEPDRRNFRKLEEKTHELNNFKAINKAVSDISGELNFSKGNGRGGTSGKGKCETVECISVDKLATDEIPDVSFIKFDLEGQEGLAIEGARQTIVNNKPKLLVAAYHRLDDLWSIPNQIMEIRDDYKIYLRKSPCIPCWEVNYYCV